MLKSVCLWLLPENEDAPRNGTNYNYIILYLNLTNSLLFALIWDFYSKIIH